jgi:hypothetical protein
MRCIAPLLVCAAVACAQDPFEIHVYEYDPMPLGSFSYEAHVNYVLSGTSAYSWSVAPTQHQLHFTSEVTAGLGESFALGAMVLTSSRPGSPIEYAGWRIIPHVFAPKSWQLPVNLGVLAEFSFERPAYEKDPAHLELRFVIEKHIGRLELDGNPVFARALSGAGSKAGWGFEPSARIGWRASRAFTPSLEYYSSWGPLQNLPPIREQIHQIVPGGDWRIGDRMVWNFGIGFGTTGAGTGAVLKTRVEWTFGARKPAGSD